MSAYSELKRLAEAHAQKDIADPIDSKRVMLVEPAAVLALIAENESSRKHWQNESNNVQVLVAEVARLKTQNDALRKDAERYRWACIEGNWVARFHGKWRAHVGEYGDKQPTDWYPSRGEAIDAAMGNGEQS